MPISQKTQYAVRAVFELAKRQGRGATKISEIAEAQAIPQRFLENILNHLKGGGFVESVRGKEGGYLLVRPAKELTVGQVLRFVEGPSLLSSAWWMEKRCLVPCTDTVLFVPCGNERRRRLKRFTMGQTSKNL
jgi:Rrf2 family protein